MSRCWHKSGRQVCDNTLASEILFSRVISYPNPQLKNLSLINKSFTSLYIFKPGGSTYKFKNVIRNFSVRINLRDRYNQFERKSAREVIRKGTNKELYSDIVKFRDNIKAVIKRHKKLSKAQTMEISSKRKSPYNNIHGDE